MTDQQTTDSIKIQQQFTELSKGGTMKSSANKLGNTFLAETVQSG